MPIATKYFRTRRKVQKPRSDQPARVDLRALRRRHGLSQALLARLLDASLRTVSGLESGSVAPARLRRNLTQINRLCGTLSEAMDSGYVGPWLDEPNEMLGGLKPVEAIERGQIDLVWQVAAGLRSGSQL